MTRTVIVFSYLLLVLGPPMFVVSCIFMLGGGQANVVAGSAGVVAAAILVAAGLISLAILAPHTKVTRKHEPAAGSRHRSRQAHVGAGGEYVG